MNMNMNWNKLKRFVSFLLIILVNFSWSFVDTNTNVTDPLIYTKLRFDRNYLQIYRKFQKYLARDEKKLTIRFNETADVNKTRLIEYTYYENDQVDAASFTQDDLIFEALDMAYKSRLLPVYIFNYDNKEDLIKASDTKLVSAKRCERDMNYLIDRLDDMQRSRVGIKDIPFSPELAAFFDSFASEEPGLLLGNYHWIGNWRQCKKRLIFNLDKSNLSNTINFKGRYCIASIRSKNWKTKANERKYELIKNFFKYPEQQYDYERFFRIQVGICLPESCDSRLIDSRRDDIHKMAVFKLSEPLRSYELADLFCLPDETSELRKIEPSGKLFIFVALIWCLTIMMATIYDCNWPKQVAEPNCNGSMLTVTDKLISSLSLIQNFKRLIETESIKSASSRANNKNNKTTPSTSDLGQSCGSGKVKLISERNKLAPSDLLFLNAIKVISMPLILFGHVGMLFKHLDRYVLDYEAVDSDLVFHFQASTPFYVDWFFVITGFLTTYLMFVTKKVERNTLIQWAYTLFHRYWRLAPIYLLLFWFSKSVFMYTSYGPIWDYGTSNMTLRSICRRESWLWPITLTSNLHPLHEECIMPAWYVASDMQFYLMTPFLLVLLYKSPLLGWLVALGTIGASISLRLHRYLTDPRAQPLELMRPRYDLYMRNNWDMHPTYLYPHYRISTYLIGVLAGHYTFMVLSGKWRSPIYYDHPDGESASPINNNYRNKSSSNNYRFRSWLRLAAWLFGFQLLVSMMFATWFISDLFPVSLEPHVKYFTALIYAFDHSASGLGMALVLTTMALGQFKRLKQLMSHPNWTVLSRINFVAFIIQVELIYWLIQSSDQTLELSHLELVKIFLYLYCFTYVFAAILTVLLEFPLAQLERQFLAPLFVGPPKRPVVMGAKSRNHQQCELARVG